MDLKTCLQVLSAEDISDDALLNCLRQINENISMLDQNNENIVNLILKLNWTTKSEEICKNYSEVVLNLVTAYSIYLRSVLRMLIRLFTPVAVPEDSNVQTNPHVHLLLQNINKLIPSMPSVLLLMLADGFPYMKKDVKVQACYLKNLFRLTEYLPSSRSAILEMVIMKLLQIDVHCPRETILDSEEHDDTEECDSIFIMENDTLKDQNHHPLANILDTLINEVFIFVGSSCHLTKESDPSSKSLNWKATVSIYKELLTIFDGVILPTHACAHVQFIMFYICSYKNLLCEGFVDYLWKKVQNPNVSSVIRQASACYMGSLLARARYVPIRMVQDCLTLMCSWINCYIDNQSGTSYSYADAVHHSTFYAVCQVVFYLITFRHKEMVHSKQGRQILQELNIERIVNCRLNPLRVCLPVVVKNFASVARYYQIAYCYTIMERNTRMFLPANNDVSCTEFASFTTLETFFPFDPYLLKRSGILIQPLYREYEGHQEDMEMEIEEKEAISESPSLGSSQVQCFIPDLLHHATSPGYRQHEYISPKFR